MPPPQPELPIIEEIREPVTNYPFKRGLLRTKPLQKLSYNSNIFHFLDECSICLCPFQHKDEIVVLPCDPRHYFHTDCITAWLDRESTNNECPICFNKIPLSLQQKADLYRKSYIVDFLTQFPDENIPPALRDKVEEEIRKKCEEEEDEQRDLFVDPEHSNLLNPSPKQKYYQTPTGEEDPVKVHASIAKQEEDKLIRNEEGNVNLNKHSSVNNEKIIEEEKEEDKIGEASSINQSELEKKANSLLQPQEEHEAMVKSIKEMDEPED